jgi:hypothetical protein
LTEPRQDPQPTGAFNWTLFLNAANFKGPLAYYLPETWSRISANYPFDIGRGLDSRLIKSGLAGAMEINTVPQLVATGNDGNTYSKIPALQFPVDENGRTVLVRDVMYFSRDAIYDPVSTWIESGTPPESLFPSASIFRPPVSTNRVTYSQGGSPIAGMNDVAIPTIFADNVFGLQWSNAPENGLATLPQHFRRTGDAVSAIAAEEVPQETFLRHREFPLADRSTSQYSALPLSGSWQSPGPQPTTYEVALGDCSKVTYQWYRFIDQPVFQQYNWSAEEKNRLQTTVERIHQNWGPDQPFLPPPGAGELTEIDAALFVTPPAGLEVGYVPIVVHQAGRFDGECAQQVGPSAEIWSQVDPRSLVGRYLRTPRDNGWHEGEITLDGDALRWTNDAGSSWRLEDGISGGRLTTGPDCPYFDGTTDADFHLRLVQLSEEIYVPNVVGFRFLQDEFVKQ